MTSSRSLKTTMRAKFRCGHACAWLSTMALLLPVQVLLVVVSMKARRPSGTRSTKCAISYIGGDPFNKRYGAWPLCTNLLRNPRIVWSFGVGCDTTFEIDLHRRFKGLKTVSFDPTIDKMRFDACRKRSFSVLRLDSTRSVDLDM